ncbi:MAG: peptide deformylase [Selenomonadaceae bacterium]|nr:peptide deformylase [Selenomonadaceae bacterium]MBQ1511179.1 peptide deformylase [Selenomonadaceae bacterium]MBQ1913609.1 peptide deformylase [Selenomonadaceae bacterium]MBQ3971769.1 peptide deformylase [Selenomonadaceae bacterium]
MSLLEIKKAGAPVLKEVCAPVEHVDKRIRTLLDDMAETMYEAEGVGLAAPQVGEAIRVVVIDVGKGLIELINPVITFREGSAKDTEGCLSVPNYYGEVERSARVKVEFLNRRGKRQHLTADGLLARCIQHELDHLEGQLFIDIAESLHEGESKS